MHEECCDAGRGNIEIYVDIVQGVAQSTLSPNLFKVCVNLLLCLPLDNLPCMIVRVPF